MSTPAAVPDLVSQYENSKLLEPVDTGATMRKYGYRTPCPPITAGFLVDQDIRTDAGTGKPYDPNPAQASA